MVKRSVKEKENMVLEENERNQSNNAKKTTTKSKDVLSKRKIVVQFRGEEVEEEAITQRFKSQWKTEHKLSEIKDLKVYYKVEEEIAYFVVNENETIAISFT